MTAGNGGGRVEPGALNLHVGELVEVRSEAEILTTLDENGAVDGLPFMPEMLAYCGKQYSVYKRADKTCDTLHYSGSRRMYDTVHLEGPRCGGEAHGGCEARCLLFWKEAWLKRVSAGSTQPRQVTASRAAPRCDRRRLDAATQQPRAAGDAEVRYRCQATNLLQASQPMKWWDVRQYVRDVRSGNVSVWAMVRALAFRAFQQLLRLRGYRAWMAAYNRLNAWGLVRTYPFAYGTPGKTPKLTLGLNPGDVVRVKSQQAILATVDERNRNRGLSFDPEMVPYCGREHRVLARVERIIDERSGKMMTLSNDCIILEGSICRAEYSDKRLFCPRSLYPFWREAWLERVEKREDAP